MLGAWLKVKTATGRRKIRIEVRFEIVVRRYLVPFAAFFVKPNPPALPVLVIIVYSHVDHRGDAREAVDHDGDHRAIPEADDRVRLDRIEEHASFISPEHGRFPALHDVPRPADGTPS